MNYSFIDNSDSNEYLNYLNISLEEKKKIIDENYMKRQENIKKIICKHKLKKLDSDYMDMSLFYLDPIKDFIWQVQNIGKEIPIFYKPKNEIFSHIKKLNEINNSNILINLQPNILE